jgi:hypothetical protein
VAGAVNIAVGTLSGAQVAGAVNVAGSASAGQVAGAVNVARGTFSGGQVAGAVNIARGTFSGGQVAGAVNVVGGAFSGEQVAGAVNVAAAAATGAQIAGALNVARTVEGAQIGPVNMAAGEVHGVQIGVVNVAETSDFSLGVINILYKGRLNFDLWALPEAGLFFAAAKNGGRHFHYIYGAGVRAAATHPVWLAFGLGVRATPSDDVFVDVDVVAHGELAFVSNNRNDLYQARVVFGYRVLPDIAVFGGPTFDVLAAWKDAPTGVAPSYAGRLADAGNVHFDGWPGIVLGIEGLR